MHLFAVRALAALHPPETEASMRDHRTALRTTLEAAGVDMSCVAQQPRVAFGRAQHHALVVWYDMPSDALRLFAPPLRLIDELTESALLLLNGTLLTDLDDAPIEDVDALARVMALMAVGGDAVELHARYVLPHLDRYDDEFSAPTIAELERLWARFLPFYVGGTSTPPTVLDFCIGRVYAFGAGEIARLETAETSPGMTRRWGRSRGYAAGLV